MDVILETPIGILMEGLAFDSSAKAALMAMKNGGGARLSPDLRPDGGSRKRRLGAGYDAREQLSLPLQFVNQAYLEAIDWALPDDEHRKLVNLARLARAKLVPLRQAEFKPGLLSPASPGLACWGGRVPLVP